MMPTNENVAEICSGEVERHGLPGPSNTSSIPRAISDFAVRFLWPFYVPE